MTHNTQSRRESSQHIATSTSPSLERSFSVVPCTRTDGAIIYSIEERVVYAPLPHSYKEVDDVVMRYEADARKAAALSRARQRLFEAQRQNGPLRMTLADLRLRKGLSQRQLAEKLGTSQSRLSRIESGLDDILLSTFEKLASALEVSRDDLAEAIGQSSQR